VPTYNFEEEEKSEQKVDESDQQDAADEELDDFPAADEPLTDRTRDAGENVVPLARPSGKGPKRESSARGLPLNKLNTVDTFHKYRSALPSMAKSCLFEWRNINVFVGNDPKTRKQILHNFNGSIRSGELLAVMGGSGAGKSTLLNALSGRTNLNEQFVSGELAINGHKFSVRDQKLIRSLCTFVPQSDLLCATQTVEEALLFYARLRLPHLSQEKQAKRVDYLIKVLHLERCRKNYIGDENRRGISGGEKRRVSIAAEILNDVDLIFLDEPTSGLDAYTAARCIKTLKEFSAHSNKIVIATIHQPSIEVFYLFDKLILLSNGECCYDAATEEVSEYFKAVLRPKTNPADVILFEIQRKGEEYVAEWMQSRLNANRSDSASNSNMSSNAAYKWEQSYKSITFDNIRKHDGSIEIRDNTKSAALCLQYQLLLKREIQSVFRDRRLALIRLLQVVFFALACGFIFYQIADDFAQKLQCMFLLCLIAIMFGMVSLLTAYPAQKQLFQRENTSDSYSTLAWALSFMIIEIPRELLVHMLLFTLIIYWLIGLDGDFVAFWMNFFLCSVTGGSFGILFGTMARSTAEAAQMMPAALVPLLMFSGAIVEIRKLPLVLQWFAYMDPMYYLINCLWIIEFEGAVYPRTLSDSDQQLCETYAAYQNGSALIDSYFKRVNNCSFVIDAIVDQYNITDYDGLSSSSSSLLTNTTAMSTTMMASTTESPYELSREQEKKLDLYCTTEIHASWLFRRKRIDPDSFYDYVAAIIIMCVLLRIIAIALLYAINNNAFSWLKKQIKQKCCGCCPSPSSSSSSSSPSSPTSGSFSSEPPNNDNDKTQTVDQTDLLALNQQQQQQQ